MPGHINKLSITVLLSYTNVKAADKGPHGLGAYELA
jgi:hypothetical protein